MADEINITVVENVTEINITVENAVPEITLEVAEGGGGGMPGPQGPQGPQGVQGPQGIQGEQGPAGANGYSAGILGEWRIQTTVGESPTSGHIRYDNATQINSANLHIDNFSIDGNDLKVIIGLIVETDVILIQDANASENFQIWNVSGEPSPIGPENYLIVPVTLSSSGGTGTSGFANNHQVILSVRVTGTVGPEGPEGPQGPQGIQGVQGIQGIQGEKGDKGDTGNTGPKGDTGNTGPAGPTAVSANAGNVATLGTDNLLLVAESAINNLIRTYKCLQSATDSAPVTGTTSNTAALSIPHNANLFEAADIIETIIGAVKTGSVGTTTIRLYWNNVNSLSGAILMSGLASAASLLSNKHIRNLPVKVANGTGAGTQGVFVASTNLATDYGGTNNLSSLAIDHTNAGFFIIAIQNGSSADSTLISFYSIKAK